MVSGGSGAGRFGIASRLLRASEPDFAGRAVHEDVGRLDVLVDEAVPVHLAESAGNADGQMQEASQLQGRPEQPGERLTAWILEHQHGPTALTRELQRPHRPRGVQLILQAVFVSESIEAGGCRMLRGRQYDEHRVPVTIDAPAVSPAEDAVAVLPQDREVALPISVESNRRIHLPPSAFKPATAVRLRSPPTENNKHTQGGTQWQLLWPIADIDAHR